LTILSIADMGTIILSSLLKNLKMHHLLEVTE